MSERTIPQLTVAESARHLVRATAFDGELYRDYLDRRGAPEDAIERLSLTVVESFPIPNVIATYGKIKGEHQISFIAREMPYYVDEQNEKLFHETEHFLWQLKHPLANKKNFCYGGVAASSLTPGIFCANETFTVTEGLSTNMRIGASALVGTVAAIAGRLYSPMPIAMLYHKFSPDEIRAKKAGKREAKQNPSIMKIQFA
jgi:hypothetical protein